MTTERESALVRMLDLVRTRGGAIIGVRPDGSTCVEAAIVLLDGPKESNLVLCASSDNWREKCCLTSLSGSISVFLKGRWG